MISIETERLKLRMFTVDDADKVTEMCNSYAVYKGTLAMPRPYTKECALDWISRQKAGIDDGVSYELAITDKATGELYGCVGMMYNKKYRHAELGYWLGEEYWNNGYTTEAVIAMIDFAFNKIGCHRVYAMHFGSNPASGRVMQKSGMTYEGTQIQHILKDDKYEDIVLYGIINQND